MSKIKFCIIFFGIHFNINSAKLLIYSEEKVFINIDVSGFEKKRGKMFLLEIGDIEDLSILCDIEGNKIYKKIYISNNNLIIYAVSKESDGSYRLRYRGNNRDSFDFLKLDDFDKIVLNQDVNNIHFWDKGDEQLLSSESNTNNKVNKTLNNIINKEKKNYLVSREYYNLILDKLESLDVDLEKMGLIKKSFNKNKKVDSSQAIKILSTIDNEVVRLEAAKSIYRFCGEKERLKEDVFDIFVYDYTRRQLRQHLN